MGTNRDRQWQHRTGISRPIAGETCAEVIALVIETPLHAVVKLFADQRTAAIELADTLREFGVYRRDGETLSLTEDDIRKLTRMAAKRQIALGMDYRFMITPAPVHVMRKGR